MPSIINPSFEDGTTGWTLIGGGSVAISVGSYGTTNGSYALQISGTHSEDIYIIQTEAAAVYPGLELVVSCDYSQGSASSGKNVARCCIRWYDENDNLLGIVNGNQINGGSAKTSTVTATAPEGAAGVRIGLSSYRNRSAGSAVDNFKWNYDTDTSVVLTYPVGGTTYTEGDSVPFRVSVSTDIEVTSVTYVATNTSTSEEITIGTSSTGDTYAVNYTELANGEYSVVAKATLKNNVVVSSEAATITIGEPATPDTREFKASNAYTYLLAKNFYGLSSSMPMTANVVGIEIIIDYSLELIARVKDKDVDDLTVARYDAVFSMIDSVAFEAALLAGTDTSLTAEGSTIIGEATLSKSDFSVVEDGTSDNKRFIRLQSDSTSITLGGEDTLFNIDYITAYDFTQKYLGLRFYPNVTSAPSYTEDGDACIRVKIDKLRIQVYFDAGSVEYYFANENKSNIIKGRLAAAYVDSGDFTTGDASGIMQMASDLEVVSGSNRSILEGYTIHSANPPSDDNQIGVVSTDMSYNGLPTFKEVAEARTRYQFISANFYGDLTYDSIYGVNGVDRAFAYNGDWFYKIHTQADATLDKARHLEFYHTHLALGYAEGRVDISVVGEPYNFNGADGASSWAVGDAVTGLTNLSGTMLGIFGKKSITGLSGSTVDNFATQVLSPKIGAVEYTIADMGFPVYANAYGIYTLSQTAEYGDYLGSPMSQDISPWLRPRLIRKDTSNKEVVCAWPVRSKNQYRLAFADGYVLTMTMNNGTNTAPTFSKQIYTYQIDGTTYPIIPAAISSELDEGGEERIHIAPARPKIEDSVEDKCYNVGTITLQEVPGSTAEGVFYCESLPMEYRSTLLTVENSDMTLYSGYEYNSEGEVYNYDANIAPIGKTSTIRVKSTYAPYICLTLTVEG